LGGRIGDFLLGKMKRAGHLEKISTKKAGPERPLHLEQSWLPPHSGNCYVIGCHVFLLLVDPYDYLLMSILLI